mmetsp:Transcript_22283/g.34464  ORF Transcript_22283/g.34464 Transcript_22283/m.34464 type:complete len:241 (-) Transcript_22283:3020-3742(-)
MSYIERVVELHTLHNLVEDLGAGLLWEVLPGSTAGHVGVLADYRIEHLAVAELDHQEKLSLRIYGIIQLHDGGMAVLLEGLLLDLGVAPVRGVSGEVVELFSGNLPQDLDLSLDCLLNLRVLIQFKFVVDFNGHAESCLNVDSLSNHAVGALSQHFPELEFCDLGIVEGALENVREGDLQIFTAIVIKRYAFSLVLLAAALRRRGLGQFLLLLVGFSYGDLGLEHLPGLVLAAHLCNVHA